MRLSVCFTIFIASLFTLSFAQPPLEQEVRYSPYDAMKIAAADATILSLAKDQPINSKNARYISLHSFTKAERKEVKAIVDYVLNSLNTRYRKIKRTAVLPAGSEDPIVVRVDLSDYNIRTSSWENLITKGSGPVPLPEPYFYENFKEVKKIKKIEKQLKWTVEEYTEKEKVQVGRYSDGSPYYEYKTVTKKRPVSKEVEVETTENSNGNNILSTASWIGLDGGDTIRSLVSNTGTNYPIARADWFITYATWAPTYYNLIGLDLKDNPVEADRKQNPKVYLEKDFENLFGFDEKKAKLDIVSGVADTKLVALHNRVLQRYNTVLGITGGYYWRSKDTDNGLDDKDYINTLIDFDNPKYDAQEIITSGRNELNFYALTDNKKRLLDVAAANVAQHSAELPTKWRDNQIYAARNCMLCHAAGQLQIKDKVRSIARGKIALLIEDKSLNLETARKVDEAFSPNLKAVLELDNAKFNAAVLAATGLQAKKVGQLFEDIVYNYYYRSVTLKQMAIESGFTEDKLLQLLKKGKKLDYNLTALLQDPPEDVSRIPYERQGYSSLMRYLIPYYNEKK